MTEIEKVKKGLSLCLSGVVSVCIACPYDAECKEARGTDQSPLLRDALKLLKEQEASEWVSVKDRLPEKLTLVLVCNHGIYDIAFVGDRGNWVNKLFEPEYWMPLPEIPKEVSE